VTSLVKVGLARRDELRALLDACLIEFAEITGVGVDRSEDDSRSTAPARRSRHDVRDSRTPACVC
jgi:hypothetical protein